MGKKTAAVVAVLALSGAVTLGPADAASRFTVAKHRGPVTDLHVGQDFADGASAHATVVTGRGRTYSRVRITGLDSSYDGITVPVHLHVGPCGVGTTAGHYKDDEAGVPAPPNELWFSFEPRNGRSGWLRPTADWQVRPDGANSIAIHDPLAGNRQVACMDIDL